MSTLSFSTSRRTLLAAAAVAGAVSLLPAAVRASSTGDKIRPFRIDIPQAQLDDLRQRLAATRWPDRETVEDQ